MASQRLGLANTSIKSTVYLAHPVQMSENSEDCTDKELPQLRRINEKHPFDLRAAPTGHARS
ncbi:hypothetical protein D3C76_1620220 [compost metagenome]